MQGQTEDADEVTVVERQFVLVRHRRQKYRNGAAGTVNNVSAITQGSTFVGQVQATTGIATLTTAAMTASGLIASQTIGINVVASSTAPVTLRVSPAIGPAPLTTVFSVAGVTDVGQGRARCQWRRGD